MYEKLRVIRNKAHIPAKEMADLLGLKTEAAYYKKENGAIRISIEEAKLIADKLDMPIEDIFFNNEVSLLETNELVNKPTGTD
jgi:DNA-binding XRE family transcriptional regulator